MNHIPSTVPGASYYTSVLLALTPSSLVKVEKPASCSCHLISESGDEATVFCATN